MEEKTNAHDIKESTKNVPKHPISTNKKVLSIIVAAVVILNLVLFSFHVYGTGPFWIVLVSGALLAYLVVPKLK
ncbi:hypothetical protein HOC01_06365 [archaeon]|jgi:membrane protein YdbS with pleckstrin-like domain|nr:hypothetical protein [archaeon]MBT6697535.1 hypothetical protein [archaeon]